MNENIKIAWRNVWRNKRRTIITASSIFFAVFFAVVLRSFQLGSYDHWTKNVIRAYTGYAQVQHIDFWDDRSIENTFDYSDELHEKIQNNKEIESLVPRLEGFALGSTGEQTKGVFLIGTDADKENQVTKLSDKLVRYRFSEESIQKLLEQDIFSDALKEKIQEQKGHAYATFERMAIHLEIEEADYETYQEALEKATKYEGTYLQANDDGVLVASALAVFLQIGVGDTIVLLGQGYQGVTAAGKYPVRGLLHFPSPDLNARMVYTNLQTAQTFFSCENRISSIALNVKNTDDASLSKTIDQLGNSIQNEEITIKSWKDLNKEMVQQIQADNSGGILMLSVLYLIIGFGIFGTVLMMSTERKREFGVMVAVGMQKYKLNIILMYEMFFIASLGIIAGILGSIPIILYGYYNPIRLTGEMAAGMEVYGIEAVMPMMWFDTYMLNQAIVVFALVIVSIVMPAIKISRMNVIKAIKG